jgi:hypothetical protein
LERKSRNRVSGRNGGKRRGSGNARDVSEVVVGRELEVVASLNLEEVGEEVGGLESEVLDNEVDLLRRVLGAGNGDVTNLVEEGGEDDRADVL